MTTSERTRPATIDVAGLRELIDSGEGPRLLDVRTPSEFETVHISGAYNVPLDLLRERRAELLDHLDGDVVLICRSGARATQAEQILTEAGHPSLKVLDGGMVAWQQAAAPVNQGRARWELERQVRLVAGSIVLLSVLAAAFIAEPFMWLAGFIGAGLVFAALSNTCGMAILLSKLPYNRGSGYQVDAVMSDLASAGRR